jgi:hypothetical protein
VAADGPPSGLFAGLTTLDVSLLPYVGVAARACNVATLRVQTPGAHRWLARVEGWW